MSVLLTIKEAAKRLSLSQSKVYRMTIDGELESIHIGRAVRVPEKAIDDLINQHPALDFQRHLFRYALREY